MPFTDSSLQYPLQEALNLPFAAFDDLGVSHLQEPHAPDFLRVNFQMSQIAAMVMMRHTRMFCVFMM